MSVFISDKDTAKLYVQFFWTKLTPNLNISATDNELIYIRDFEAVQKTRSRVLSSRNIRILLNRIIAIE